MAKTNRIVRNLDDAIKAEALQPDSSPQHSAMMTPRQCVRRGNIGNVLDRHLARGSGSIWACSRGVTFPTRGCMGWMIRQAKACCEASGRLASVRFRAEFALV
jgi:hypothetical protein